MSDGRCSIGGGFGHDHLLWRRSRTGRGWTTAGTSALAPARHVGATLDLVFLAGLALIALPNPGMAAGMGAYLADDWALMTETIPLISSGRYMGLANVANSIATAAGLRRYDPAGTPDCPWPAEA